MKSLFTAIFGMFSLGLLLILGKIAVLVFTDNTGYLGVFAGLLLTTLVCIRITAVIYSMVESDKSLH